MAQLFYSIEMTCENAAWLYGTKGWLKMEHFWKCERFEVQTEQGRRTIELPFVSNGFYHEIEEAVQCIQSRKIESPLMSLTHSKELSGLVEATKKLIRNL